MAAILLTIVVLLLGVLYWQYKRKYAYWTDRNITSLPVLPIVGSYNKFLISHQANVTNDFYNHYRNEKYVGGFKGSEPELLVLDPDIIRLILVKDFNNFVSRGLMPDDDKVLNQNLFALGGKRWKTLRQKISPTFTSLKMKNMFHLIVACGEALELFIREGLKSGEDLEISELMARFTTDTIGTCAFGLKTNSLQEEQSPFRKMGTVIFTPPTKLTVLKQLLNTLSPTFFGLFNMKLRPKDKQMESFFLNIVKQLVASRPTPSPRNDFIDAMLELRSKGAIEIDKSTGIEYQNDAELVQMDVTDELITAQCFVFFAAGFETSATTMSYALREMALNPEIQKKLQEEIDTVLSRYEEKLTYDAVQEMEYLDMVLDETLRKYPPVPVLNRVCNSTYKLPGTNEVIDKGVKILIPVYGLHHDAKYFPDPEKFAPERFLKTTENSFAPFTYMPFGEGPRICIGARFGKLQAAMGLISFLKNYSVKPCAKTASKVELQARSFVLTPKGGIHLKVLVRNTKLSSN